MLMSVVFELERLDIQGIQTINGRQVHAWLLDLVRKRDSSFSEELHLTARHKPFTVAVGTRSGALEDGVANLSPKEPHLIFRITSLSNKLTILLGESIQDLREIRLDGTAFSLQKVSLNSCEHMLAGTSTFEQIWEDSRINQPLADVVLRFLTPTAFSYDSDQRSDNRVKEFRDRRNTLFPIARLVFTSLSEKWKEYAPEKLIIPPDIQRIFLDLVREEAHAINTMYPLDYHKFQLKGFVGRCAYSVGYKATAELRHMLHALASFAFYGGVGLKTTSGMGLTIGAKINE